MRQSTVLLLAVTGIVTLCTVFDGAAGQAVCVHCVCPPSYSPVCGYRDKTKSLRGFPSRCVLECSNKCRKNIYEFVFNGRCGKYTPSSTPETPSSTMAHVALESADTTSSSIMTYSVTEAAHTTRTSVMEHEVTEAEEDSPIYSDKEVVENSTVFAASTASSSSPSAAAEEMHGEERQSSGYRGAGQQMRRSRPRSRFVASR